MIRMIVTDLDGTLLRTDKTVSAHTASVFQRCKERGIKIVFATARPIRAVNTLHTGIEPDAVICHNGAVTLMGDVRFGSFGIEYETAAALLRATREIAGLRIAVESGDVIYANFDVNTVWPDIEPGATFADLPELPVDKILFITAEASAIAAIERLFDDTLYWEIADSETLMVMDRRARKRNAVAALAEHFGIALSELAAFGDDNNDIEMLRDCGIGVAVANAIDPVKTAADHICRSNDEDGIAKWIEETILDL